MSSQLQAEVPVLSHVYPDPLGHLWEYSELVRSAADRCVGCRGSHGAVWNRQCLAAKVSAPASGAATFQKHDAGKARYDLVDQAALSAVVAVLTHGAAKYGDDNWRKGFVAAREATQGRYYAAMMRHVESWRSGAQRDRESGFPHLAHAVCCLLFLLAEELTRGGGGVEEEKSHVGDG